ncbi:hypothetical protein OpiT1DRAFT_05648 [Opitutaceae bacterium TAV1]|nr:hypothetical protein OpiT1DRAFT_05648 [Opitutaceae bacterium TAV1]
MPLFRVTITETLRYSYSTEAETAGEAEEIALQEHADGNPDVNFEACTHRSASATEEPE